MPVGDPTFEVTVAVSTTDVPTGAVVTEEVSAVDVVAVTIICVSAVEVDPAKTVSPAYCAVMLCVPTPSVLMAIVACAEAFSVPVPMTVVPSRNCTVPPGCAPLAPPEMVAVKVTDVPGVAVASDELNSTAVAFAAVMVSVWSGAVSVRNAASPEYAAYMSYVPAASAEVVNVAVPEASSVACPRFTESLKKVMVPVGTLPETGASVAVNVTGRPVIVAVEDKVSEIWERANCAAIAVPFSAMISGLEVLLSVMVRVPVCAPIAVGAKERLIMQLSPTARVEPQSFVCVN